MLQQALPAELDGLQPTIGYVDASVVKPLELGKLVLQKLSQLSSVEEELTHDLEVWRVVGARNAPYVALSRHRVVPTRTTTVASSTVAG